MLRPLFKFLRLPAIAVPVSLIALALAGCSGKNSYPPDWSPVVTYVSDICPDISGVYSVSDRAMYQALAAHYDKEPRRWSVIRVGGDPQRELRLTLYEANTGTPIEEPVRRTRGSDYECTEGDLRMRWPGGIPFLSEGEEVPADELAEKTLHFAKNRAGELVALTELAHWKGIAVWCGDGCKYLPIPFTRSSESSWSRWEPTTIPTPLPAGSDDGPADASVTADAPPNPARDAWNAEQKRRVAASQARRAEEDAVVQLLLPTFPKDMVLTNFSRKDAGFVAELRHKDADSFDQLRDSALASGHFRSVEVGESKYTDGYGRRVVDVELTVRPQD